MKSSQEERELFSSQPIRCGKIQGRELDCAKSALQEDSINGECAECAEARRGLEMNEWCHMIPSVLGRVSNSQIPGSGPGKEPFSKGSII